MEPEVVITPAMIDNFDNEKDVKDMLYVFPQGFTRASPPVYQVTFGVWRKDGNVKGVNASFPFSPLGKVMSGLMSDILSCYSIGSAVRNRRWRSVRGLCTCYGPPDSRTAVFGGDKSGGLLDWLIDECDAGHRPGVGQLAAEFERRYLGRPVPQGSRLDRMKTLWGTVASKVAEYLLDPAASAVLQAAWKQPHERSPYEKELVMELLKVLHEMKRRQRLLPQEVRGRAVHAIVHAVHMHACHAVHMHACHSMHAIPPSLPRAPG
jgi:hypothetical protein